MKIQCDVCGTGAASVFCPADEAALCSSCDHRVHHANKLASKHHRLALLHPKQSPLCDICQEKRAFLFCQQDRAILCRDCDVPIHNNEHTKKHNRFLLTGLKLSAAATATDDVPHQQPCTSKLDPTTLINPIPNPPTPSSNSSSSSLAATKSKSSDKTLQAVNDSSTNISDYLMEMLPGWHVEDLLLHPFGFNQKEDGMLPIFTVDSGGTINSFSSSDHETMSMGELWVPQSPSHLYFPEMNKDQTKDQVGSGISKRNKSTTTTYDVGDDDLFAVPQLSLPVPVPGPGPGPGPAFKRSRPLW